MWMGRLRVLRRTWRTGGGGSVPQLQPPRRCSSMSGHSQAGAPPVPHGPFGSACGMAVLLGELSRSGWVQFRGVPGERGSCWVAGRRGRW